MKERMVICPLCKSTVVNSTAHWLIKDPISQRHIIEKTKTGLKIICPKMFSEMLEIMEVKK